MTDILTNIGTFFTQVVTWAGEILDLMATNPILLISLGMLVVGFVVAWVSRLIRAN